MNFADFQARVPQLLQDAAHSLEARDRDALIQQFIQQRYSKDRPLDQVSDLAGTGTALLALPGTWEDGFSLIESLEFPVGNVPPTYIADDAWQMYRGTDGTQKLMLLADTPAATDTVRAAWIKRHLADGTTVYAGDFEAVCDGAAALCLEAMAARYAQTGDSTMQADVVNYRTKSAEYLALAKALRKRYFDHMGVGGDGTANSASSAAPALSQGDLNETMGWGGDRITHPKAGR